MNHLCCLCLVGWLLPKWLLAHWSKVQSKILLKFRSYSVAIIVDIEKAFWIISVNPQWSWCTKISVGQGSLQYRKPEIGVLRFTLVVFGISASPFLLNATQNIKIEGYAASQPEVVRLLAHAVKIYWLWYRSDWEREVYTLYANSMEILLSIPAWINTP